MDRSLERLVRDRAEGRCEYCLFPQKFDDLPFEIDHILAQQHGGETDADNLCLCCCRCNRHKGPNIAGWDPVTKKVITLFHPRHDRWARHFRYRNATIEPRTAVGRVTAHVLAFNLPLYLLMREALIDSDDFF